MEPVQVAFNGLAGGATIALIALGLSLIFGVLRIVNFAHGVLFTLGAYVTYVCAVEAGLPYFVAVAVATATVAVAAVVLALTVFRQFRTLTLEGAIASVALAIVLESILDHVFEAIPREVPTPVSGSIEVGSAFLSLHRLLLIAVTLALFAALWLFVTRSRYGRAIRAVTEDSEIARIQGVEITRVMVVAFALGGALAGIAGGLVAPDTSVLPSMGSSPLLLAFVAIVVGGMGDIRGTLVAALSVGIVQSVVSTYWDPAAATWVAYSLVLVVLIFRSRQEVAYA